MTRRKALTAIFVSAICALSAWSQATSSGCDKDSFDNGHVKRTRTHGTAIENADGKPVSVASPVRELKVASLTFVGDPALPPAMMDETARSLRELDYEDNKEGLEELLERVRDAW